MKYILAFFTVSTLPIAFCIGQCKCRSIDSIIIDIKEANYLKKSKIITGLSSTTFEERIDSQYLRYEELKNCASIDELKNLLRNEHNVVVAYSWKAFLTHNPKEALIFLTEHSNLLSKREVSIFLNLCQGTVTNTLAYFMVNELYDKLLSREINLTSSEIVDFLNLKEEMVMKKLRPVKAKDF